MLSNTPNARDACDKEIKAHFEIGGLGKAIAIALVTSSLAACGGSGDAPTPPPAMMVPPQPAPPPPPPQASATSDKAEVDEGQPFVLDASGSTDPQGSGLTFAWAQTSGPNILIADPSLAVLALEVPELTATATAIFTLDVSDGTLSDSTSISVELTNVFQSPQSSGQYAKASTLMVPGLTGLLKNVFSTQLVGTQTSDTSPLELGIVGFNAISGELELRPSVFPRAFGRDLRLNNVTAFTALPDNPIVAIEESSDRVTVLTSSTNAALEQEYASIGEVTIASPCDSNLFLTTLGQGSGGLTGVDMPFSGGTFFDPAVFNPVALRPVAQPGRLCAIASVFDTADALDIPPALTADLAIDVVGQRAHSFRRTGPIVAPALNQDLELADSIALELDTSEALSFVASVSTETATQSRGLFALFSNMEHDGVHRLVFVGLDQAGAIVQSVYAWDKGIPSDLVYLRDNGSERERVIILSSSSPEAIQFTVPAGSFDLGAMEGPSFLEIGLGAESIEPFDADGDVIAVSFPKQEEVTEFQFVP